MVVNAPLTVDKPDFFHMLKGLRAPELAGKTLLLERSKTGQYIGAVKKRRFRTFDPVDMHGFIHTSGRNVGDLVI